MLMKPLTGLVWIGLAFFLLSAESRGCSRKKAVSLDEKPATSQRSVDYLLRKLKAVNVSSASTLSAKANLYMQGNGQSISASANLIWIRDSVLWLNIKKFGLEGFRVLITKDSAYILNRLEKTLTVRSLESLQREYKLPEAGFSLLQHVLLASAWFFPDIVLKSDIKDSRHRLSGANGRWAADYRLDEGAFLLRSESFLRAESTETVTLTFERYEKVPGYGPFPLQRRVEAFSTDSGPLKVDIELSNLVLNEAASYRFEVPDHYKRLD
jgi:Domain of unknown function (DUF4292)